MSSGNAGLRWIANKTPNLEEAAAAFKRIVSDGHRAGEVIATDPAYAARLADAMPHAKTIFEIGGAVLTVVIGYWLQRRARAKKHTEPVDLAAEGRKE